MTNASLQISPAAVRLSDRLGYQFLEPRLLVEALTHSSASRDIKPAHDETPTMPWNERLEFLGDAVLSLALSAALMRRPEILSEGELSKIRASLVNEKSLAAVSREINLGDALILGRGEERNHGRTKDSVLADALEALFGAIYLDAGFAAAEATILGLFATKLAGPIRDLCELDFKTRLQELTQGYIQQTPSYEVVDQSGPDHEAKFEVEVRCRNRILGRGTGDSKKAASQKAAEIALQFLNMHPDILREEEVNQ